ncbi:MAG TPA: sulfate ABC transporter permease subunit CysW [Alcaligenes sp.]|nr:sulfate ABC transporter permease subunit CysW [Alcaligenes sp.]HRL26509.1 sulfate ABC transporter permease subunit CysW [Alcaligenes sp.]
MRKAPKSLADRCILVAGLALVLALLVAPLLLIFSKALGDGLPALWSNLQEDFMLHAIGLTLFIAVLTVPLNMLLGILLAWCLTHYQFRGRRLLSTLIDLPYAVSPVVAGLCYLVVYGVESSLGQWFSDRNIQLMFAWPGMVLVTLFVTTPYVARILIPVMQEQGSDAQAAALSLGASGWQIFWHVTLPDIKWALMYGVVLTNARAIGEFGAVSVVSGTIMNQTLTLSLLVDQLNNDNKAAAAFTAAALLATFAIVSVMLKSILEWRVAAARRRNQADALP